jgi:hypothetical protein
LDEAVREEIGQKQIPAEEQEQAEATANTGILRLRCSQSAVSNFAQDDECFGVEGVEGENNCKGKNKPQKQTRGSSLRSG